MAYRYYLTQRGVAPGCQPSGFTNWEDTPNGILTNGAKCYGFIEYERELTEREVKDYELTPHSNAVHLQEAV